MRYWPRGVRKGSYDEWMRELAPSVELLRTLKLTTDAEAHSGPPSPGSGYDWRTAYREEMRLQGASIAVLRARLSVGKTLTLLCACHDPNQCHRLVLADILADGGRLP